MKKYICVLFLVVLTTFVSKLYSQTHVKPVYVIVHGAWGGSWAFKNVASLLSEDGNIVYRPSLTGQGERVHLASTSINLKTHITDVVIPI